MDEADVLRLFQLCCDTAERSPALAAAQNGDLEHLTTVVAGALAERVGADPEDPEIQIAAIVVLPLGRTKVRATFRHVRDAKSIAALDAAVRTDVERAVHLAAPTPRRLRRLRPQAPSEPEPALIVCS